MAVPANFACPDREKFQYCYSKLVNFTYSDDTSVKTDLNLLLDQLNSLEYSAVVVSAKDGNQLLVRLCTQVPLHEDRLIVKLCQVANAWMKKQMLHLSDETIVQLTGYLIKAVQRCPAWAVSDILRTMASLLYENADKLEMYHELLLGRPGILIQLINNDVTDIGTLKEAVMCVQCLTLKPASLPYLSAAHIDVCYDIFCMLLHKTASVNMDPQLQGKILIFSLRGIQNILRVTKEMPPQRLGMTLAAVRAYMFYGVYSDGPVIPDKLYPSPLTRLDAPASEAHTASKKTADKPETATNSKKPRRKTKKKPEKGGKNRADTSHDDLEHEGEGSSSNPFGGHGAAGGIDLDVDPMAGYAQWSKVSSSDSEYSDNESGLQGSRSRSNFTKVRQCALGCFYWISKFTEKKVMFSFWSSFLPDSQTATSASNAQTLLNIILKDPSPKCRMGALAALSVLMDNTKLLLSAAEDRDDTKITTFTPFSVILGSLIKEVHRCLFLALISEEYPITLTQLIKCFGTVIANVPYHRMRPGLLSKIVKHVRHFIYHRDSNVRVACLTCLGAMSGIQPPLMEVCHIIQSAKPPVTSKPPVESIKDPDTLGVAITNPSNSDSGFSSSPVVITTSSGTLQQGGGSVGDHSGGATPNRLGTTNSSGMMTPNLMDPVLQGNARELSWVVKLCVKNILPQKSPDTVFGNEEPHVEPLPVRLESLQVLANLTKGYFPVIRNCVPLLQELVHQCFCDNDPVVKLHTAKLLDEFTQVLQQDVNTAADQPQTDRLHVQQVLEFWLGLMNGPIQEILQSPGHDAVKATVCDCIANIGDPVFRLLPLDKRVLCLTVVLGLASDEDRFIKAAAIRTLGIYVLYRSLREDVSFVADCTSAIIGALDDRNMSVKVKAAWSLANLGDAIASNREEGNTEFLEEFSDVLLLNILTMATRLCQEADKIKPNGVRTLGNILRCMTRKHLGKEAFSQCINTGMKALVKCAASGAMKVRWNACYALSNMYKNTDLCQGQAAWNTDVLTVLCSVMKECKNFKVRINAAIALSTPRARDQLGPVPVYCKLWTGIVEAFITAEEITDFIDFRYRDNLTEQISLAALRILELLTVDDLETLLPILHQCGEQLTTSLDKYYTARANQSTLEESLVKAVDNVKQVKSAARTDGQKQCIEILDVLCTNLTTVKEEVVYDNPSVPVKTGFLQTYD